MRVGPLVYGLDSKVAKWVSEQIWNNSSKPVPFSPGAVAIGIIRDERIVGGAVFHDWQQGNMHITFASATPRSLTKFVVSGVLAYPFETAKCRRLTAICHFRNYRVRKLLEGVGFEQEGIHKAGFPDGDAVTYGLTAKAWKKGRFGGQKRAITASGS